MSLKLVNDMNSPPIGNHPVWAHLPLCDNRPMVLALGASILYTEASQSPILWGTTVLSLLVWTSTALVKRQYSRFDSDRKLQRSVMALATNQETHNG